MTYVKCTIHVPDPYQEFLIADLMDLDFYGFEQFDDKLVAYIDRQRFDDTNRETLEQLLVNIPEQNGFEIEEIEEENWNSRWEKGILPISAGAFFIRPTWNRSEPDGDQIVIEIDPKMSFGTGFHETTRLMLSKLSELDMQNKNVLDAGTGTGILAIAACKLGASGVFAFDIDPWSIRNAEENFALNNVSGKIQLREGGEELLEEHQTYHLIMANVNRNVLLQMLPVFEKMVTGDGSVLLSGLLNEDIKLIDSKLKELNMKIIDNLQESEWILMHLEKEMDL